MILGLFSGVILSHISFTGSDGLDFNHIDPYSSKKGNSIIDI